MKLCHSEEDYDEIASDTSHIVVEDENDNKDEIPFDPYVFALKVLKNEAAEIKPKEAWHDDTDNEVNDNDDVEKKQVKKFSIRKWIGNLFGGCVRTNIES